MANTLWDVITSKVDRFADVAQRQGLSQAIGLALGKDVTEQGIQKQELYENYSEKVLSDAWKQKESIFQAKLNTMEKEHGTKAVDKWLKSKEGQTEFDKIYGKAEAKYAEKWHKTKVYDDDLFDWQHGGNPTDKVPQMGEGEEGILMPTRPGAYGLTDDYIPLGPSVEGKWLTPDEGGGLIMTDERKDSSIERMRHIWKHGDTLEGAFINENTYNLLFEDKSGDVSIVQSTDYLHQSGENNFAGGLIYNPITDDEKKSHSGILDMINKLNPQNIYYQDAGMNAPFYSRSRYDDDDIVPYGNTTTMMGKIKNGERFVQK